MLELVIFVCIIAFCCELLDASLGQGYGTLGSPIFLLMGFSPKVVVPSILLSQAIGGFSAGIWHHKYGNVNFSNHKTVDFKRVYFIVVAGIIGVVVAAFIGIKAPKDLLTAYIGVVVLVMGVLLLSGKTFKFTWKKLSVIGAISAFNKGLSGGGYGPVVTGGQAIIGVNGKNSVAITDLAEAPICIAGFSVYLSSVGIIDPLFTLSLCVGAILAPPLGAYITKRIPAGKFLKLLGAVIFILGVLTLAKVLNP